MDYNHNDNREGWDKWNSNASNSSYYNQPVHRPYGQIFSIASAVCGLLSLMTCCTIVLSLPLGALGLLFAVLAYRKGRKTSNICVTGITLSCIGLAVAAALIVYSFVMLPALMRNDVFRRQINAVSQQMYGMDFDAFLEEYYGYSFED